MVESLLESSFAISHDFYSIAERFRITSVSLLQQIEQENPNASTFSWSDLGIATEDLTLLHVESSTESPDPHYLKAISPICGKINSVMRDFPKAINSVSSTSGARDHILNKGHIDSWFKDPKNQTLRFFACDSVGQFTLPTIIQSLNVTATLLHPKTILAFSCTRFGSQQTSVRIILASFLHQLFRKCPPAFERVKLLYEWFEKLNTWTVNDLKILFVCASGHYKPHQVVCIIEGADSINGDRIWKDMEQFGIKVILILRERQSLVLSDSLNLEITSKEFKGATAASVQLEILSLIAQKPAWGEFEHELRQKFLHLDDSCLKIGLNIKGLMGSSPSSSPNSMKAMLEAPLREWDRIFEDLLSRIPNTSSKWARSALAWILFSFRPLIPSELAAALAFEEKPGKTSKRELQNSVGRYIVQDLQTAFGPIVRIERGEISFAHEGVRQYLLDRQTENDVYKFGIGDHQVLAQCCMNYLTAVQQREKNDQNESLSLSEFSAFSNYAAEYWPYHCNQASENLGLDECTTDFLASRRNSTSLSKFSDISSFSSSLEIALGFGCDRIAKQLLGKDPRGSSTTDCALDIAAYQGNKEMVAALLERGFCGEYPVHRAARAGNLNVLLQLHAKGIPYDTPDADGLTAMHFAARGGHLDIVEHLKENAFCLSYEDKVPTPLYEAAAGGHSSIAGALLKKEEDIDSVKKQDSLWDNSAMAMAAKHGHKDVVVELLEAGMSIKPEWKLRTCDRETFNKLTNPIREAIAECHIGILKTLLEWPISRNRMTLVEETVEQWDAAIQFEVDTASTTSKACQDEFSGEILSRLTKAAEKGNSLLLRILLRAKTKSAKEVYEKQLRSAIIDAVDRGHCAAVKELLDADVSASTIDEKNANRATLLHKAVSNNNFEIVMELVNRNKGLNISTLDAQSLTPLHLASREGFINIVEFLLQNRPSIEAGLSRSSMPSKPSGPAKDEDGTQEGIGPESQDSGLLTPSQSKLAGEGASPSRLISKVSDTFPQALNSIEPAPLCTDTVTIPAESESKDNNSTGPIIDGSASIDDNLLETQEINPGHEEPNLEAPDLSTENTKELCQQELDQGPMFAAVTPLHLAAQGGHLEVVKLLLDYKEQIDARGPRGETPLHFAACHGKHNVVETLLDFGANKEATNTNGETPLFLAALNGWPDVINKLINHGANIECVSNFESRRPIHAAVTNETSTETLIKFHCEVDSKTTTSETALMLASTNSCEETVELLLEAGAGINLRSNTQSTALHAAVVYSNLGVTKALLRRNPDLEIADENGDTPLHLAVRYGTNEIVMALLDSGARLSLTNDSGQTLLDEALGGEVSASPLLNDDCPREVFLACLAEAAINHTDLGVQILLRFNNLTNSHVRNRALSIAIQAGYFPLWQTICQDIPEKNDLLTEWTDPDNWTLSLLISQTKNGNFHAEAEKLGIKFSDTFTDFPPRPTQLQFLPSGEPHPEIFQFYTDAKGVTSFHIQSPGAHARRANHPFPPEPPLGLRSKGCNYFEATFMQVLGGGSTPEENVCRGGIGVCGEFANFKNAMPGWKPHSVGYHADDGGVYQEDGNESLCNQEPYGKGDVVGCGVSWRLGGYFFTKNGKLQGDLFKWGGVNRKMYPVIGSTAGFMSMEVNFGERDFAYKDLRGLLKVGENLHNMEDINIQTAL
ncbi:hypothetical protein G7Y89_g15008 [Cudoniella acicularis]|uniref:B30.2/SPRY domain-containing protein n=1 Tax=Cudoniella acicularis TaxID=354080 RepID=A0A8H4VQ62_9HELO|nr:hypothetical protein G7Y89_g15008 [Cudoniella acicularis]